MDKKEILKMIANGESETLEFKLGEIRDFSNIYRTMCAFANNKGGFILFGISDNGEVKGCDPRYIDFIRSKIQNDNNKINPITPIVTPIVEAFVIADKTIACISVKKSNSTHTYKGIKYIRIRDADVEEKVAKAYKAIGRSGVYNFLMHGDSSQISSYEAAFRVLEPFKEWVEDHKGWKTILDFPKSTREKNVQRLIDLRGRSYCEENNIDMSFEANEGSGPIDLKLSRGNDKTIIEIKLSSNPQYLHGFEVQIEEYARAENTNNRIYVYIQVGNPIRDRKINELYQQKKEAGESPPHLFVIDSQERKSASQK